MKNQLDLPTEAEAMVLNLLNRSGPKTTGEIIDLLGLSESTAYDAISGVIESRWVRATSVPRRDGKKGRPAKRLEVIQETGGKRLHQYRDLAPDGGASLDAVISREQQLLPGGVMT